MCTAAAAVLHHVRVPCVLAIYLTHRTLKCSFRVSLTNSEFEVIEGVFVDNIQLPHQGECKLHHGPYVHVLPVMLLGNSNTLTHSG